MKPHEQKALELIDKYLKYFGRHYEEKYVRTIFIKDAKQCAIIAVQLVIDEMEERKIHVNYDEDVIQVAIDYWNNVKTQLLK